MNPARRLALFLFLILFLRSIIVPAQARELQCDQLRELTDIIAKDSTITAARLAETGKSNSMPKYSSRINIFGDAESNSAFSYIVYDKDNDRYTYNAECRVQGSEIRPVKDKMKACLGADWIFVAIKQNSVDSAYYLKNISTYVVIQIKQFEGSALITCYNDARHSAPVCVSGNCDNGFGKVEYFNGDTYEGSFVEGKLNGHGSYTRNEPAMLYSGSFTDGRMAGQGTLLRTDSGTIQNGVFFNGGLVKLDTAQKTCQAGNCETGLGLKVIEGGYYAGRFFMGQYDGPGELVYKNSVLYGNFAHSMHIGNVILTYSPGDYIFASYWNGVLQGKYERVMPDKTTVEGFMEITMVNIFYPDNILYQSGDLKSKPFTEKKDPEYVANKTFASSLEDFYQSKRADDFMGISGEISATTLVEREYANMGYPVRKSTKLFLNEFDAKVTPEKGLAAHYITIDLSKKNPAKANLLILYKKYHERLKNAVGRHWRVVTDEWFTGYYGAKNKECTYTIRNIDDKTMLITLKYNKITGISLAIH